MKITRSELKQIIKEEIMRMHEQVTNKGYTNMKNYEVTVYKKGNPLTTYLVRKKGNTAAAYINAHTKEEAVERYKEFMKK